MAERSTRIFVVDDHPLVREWLATLLNQQPDMVVVGEAEDMAGALAGVAKSPPDVAIVDISLKGASGIDLIRAIKAAAPRVEVVVLSMHDERLYAERAIRAGARGYITKRETARKLVAAVRRVREGRLYVSDEMASLFAERFLEGAKQDAASPVALLSDRELDVFSQLGEGRETRQIAERLNVSIKTVQSYCARIKEKMRLASAVELLREAVLWRERQGTE
ncbi:MAG TPA: response regulator transcription factor [Caulobacteraceae bacterium]|nr:response regulator transcription factor [Caulobacteraceae bacterium]